MIFDVLVTGAGPAGCSAAIRAAKGGLTVGLAEACAFPRDLPGEALDPDVDIQFRKLGVASKVAKAGFLRGPGWTYCRGGERTLMLFSGQRGLRLGYQAWRADLDSVLLERAASLGVRIMQPGRAREFKAGKTYSSVRVNGEEVCFRHLVDASGSNSWLRRELQLPLRRISAQLTARYGYWPGHPGLGTIPEFHQHECGWTWLARVRSDFCQFVRLSLDGSALPDLPAPFPSLPRSRGADVTWRFVPQCAGEGYFLCGDAAGVLDPTSTSRVRRAMASGIRAAELIARIEGKRMDKAQAAAAYRKWSADRFAEQAQSLAERYRTFELAPAWLKGIERELLAIKETKAYD